MDEAEIGAAESDLVQWGILERAPTLQATRRFRGAIMRAAAELQEEERAGGKREGHAMEVAVRAALRKYPLPPGARLAREHELLVVGVEIASLPDAVRAMLDV